METTLDEPKKRTYQDVLTQTEPVGSQASCHNLNS